MTAKEKAEEIRNKTFTELTKNSNYKPLKEDLGKSFHIFSEKAKSLAIICVDELLKEYKIHNSERESFFYSVKKELEKM